MRPYELILCACLCLLIAALMANQHRLGRNVKLTWIAYAIVIIAAAAQLFIEQFRWQLALAYGVIAVLPFVIARTSRENEMRSLKRIINWLAACVIISGCLPVLVPIPHLPAPSGPFSVGTQSYDLIDQNRRETLASDAKQRQLTIQVWYPTVSSAIAKIAPYMPAFTDLSVLRQNLIFPIVASHLSLVPTHSTQATPVSSGSHPVLIFSHGLMGGRFQNTVLAEELASHGYIVVGIDHTYDCSFAFLPEETICSVLLTRIPPPVELLTGEGLQVRAHDVSFVLDQLTKLNAADAKQLLTRHLDLDRVGVYGHSLGGQTALLVCAMDKRIKAGLSMDGTTLVFKPLSQPFMVMQAGRPGDPLNVINLRQQLFGPHYVMTLQGAEHANFTDLPLLTPVHWVAGLSGPINEMRATIIVDAYVLAFFNCYLQEKPEPILQSRSSFPEVRLEIYKTQEQINDTKAQ